MARAIDQFLAAIRQAIYGRDVREAIASGIEQCYNDSTASAQKADIEAKGAEVLASIPDTYEDLQSDVDGLKSALNKHAISQKSIRVEISKNGQNTKIYGEYPQGTELGFTIYNVDADIDGNVSGAVRLIYLSDGVETIDMTYRMTFGVYSTSTVINRTLTLPMDIIGIQLFFGNYGSDVTVRKCQYDIDFYCDRDKNIQNGYGPFVSFTAPQSLTNEQKSQATSNIDAATVTDLTDINRVVSAYSYGIELNTNTRGMSDVNVVYAHGEKLSIVLDMIEADYSGSIAIGVRYLVGGQVQTKYAATFDSPNVGRHRKDLTIPYDIDGIRIEGFNRASGSVVNNLKAKLLLYDGDELEELDSLNGELDSLNGELDSLNGELDSLNGELDATQTVLGVENVEEITTSFATTNITDWVYNMFAVVMHSFDDDRLLTRLEYNTTANLKTLDQIEESEVWVGTVDQRLWFLPRKQIIDYTISLNTSQYSTRIIITFTNMTLYAGEVVAVRLSCPNLVNNLNVWASLSSNNYDANFRVIRSATLSGTFTETNRTFQSFAMFTLPMSRLYATKNDVDNVANTVNAVSASVTKLATTTDLVTGDTYKLVVVNGVVQAKSLEYRKLWVLGHSFTQHGASSTAGWFRDDGDMTALIPSLKDRDFCGWLTTYLGATVKKPGGVPFERAYSVDYDFATLLATLDTTYDAVIVFLGDNATYSDTMQASWEALFAAIHAKVPMADIYASGPWSGGDKYAAINAAIANCSYVTNVDLTLIRQRATNHSDTWQGGEYYIGRNSEYYPVYTIAASHPNDFGHWNIANAYIQAMGKEPMKNTVNIILNQTTGGTISTPSTEWLADAVVTIRVEPNSGYTLSGLTVVDANDNVITTVERTNDQRTSGTMRVYHTFIMPNRNVTITPTWSAT